MLMSDFHPIEKSTKPELESVPRREGGSAATDVNLIQPQQQDARQNESTSSRKLTADEQMALYEKALKEDDWGHQPC